MVAKSRPCFYINNKPGYMEGALSEMHRHKWDRLLIPNIAIIVWAALFLCCLFIPDGGILAAIFAPGHVAWLFISIPLATVSLIARAKKQFSKKISVPILVFSILNICIGIADWFFLLGFIQMP